MKKVFNISYTLGLLSFYLFNVVTVAAQNPVTVNPGPQVQPLTGVTLTTIPQFIITFLLILAVLLAVIFIIWGGIQWILSGGDKGKVEAARNHIVAAVIGLIVAFAVFVILNIVFGILGINNPLNGKTFNLPCLKDPTGAGCPSVNTN